MGVLQKAKAHRMIGRERMKVSVCGMREMKKAAVGFEVGGGGGGGKRLAIIQLREILGGIDMDGADVGAEGVDFEWLEDLLVAGMGVPAGERKRVLALVRGAGGEGAGGEFEREDEPIIGLDGWVTP